MKIIKKNKRQRKKNETKKYKKTNMQKKKNVDNKELAKSEGKKIGIKIKR